jgi:hypothetical protein
MLCHAYTCSINKLIIKKIEDSFQLFHISLSGFIVFHFIFLPLLVSNINPLCLWQLLQDIPCKSVELFPQFLIHYDHNPSRRSVESLPEPHGMVIETFIPEA